MRSEIFKQKGAMALGSILVLTAILLALGLAMVFSGFIQGDIAFNQGKSLTAFYIAEAGAKDAMQKIARNKKYNYADPGYSLVLAGGTAAVIVKKDQPAIGQTEILSKGTVGVNTKKIKVILNTDAAGDAGGKIAIISWEEVAN